MVPRFSISLQDIYLPFLFIFFFIILFWGMLGQHNLRSEMFSSFFFFSKSVLIFWPGLGDLFESEILRGFCAYHCTRYVVIIHLICIFKLRLFTEFTLDHCSYSVMSTLPDQACYTYLLNSYSASFVVSICYFLISPILTFVVVAFCVVYSCR